MSFPLLAGLFLAGGAVAGDPFSPMPINATGCSSCGTPRQPPSICQLCKGNRNAYHPPYVHPGTPFGYYPTCWREWPGGETCNRPVCGMAGFPINVAPMLLPRNPDSESLPPPRPAEPTMLRPQSGEPINTSAFRK